MTGSLTEWLDAEALLAAFFSFFQTESMPNTQPMILDDYCNDLPSIAVRDPHRQTTPSISCLQAQSGLSSNVIVDALDEYMDQGILHCPLASNTGLSHLRLYL